MNEDSFSPNGQETGDVTASEAQSLQFLPNQAVNRKLKFPGGYPKEWDFLKSKKRSIPTLEL